MIGADQMVAMSRELIPPHPPAAEDAQFIVVCRSVTTS
jgi:hypothetical protein